MPKQQKDIYADVLLLFKKKMESRGKVSSLANRGRQRIKADGLHLPFR